MTLKTKWSGRTKRLDNIWRKPRCQYYRKTVRDTIVELIEGGTVLDVGCGSGILFDHLPDDIKSSYVGLDVTPEFINLCKEKYPEGSWIHADAHNIPFPDKSFTLVNSSTVLQHITDWQNVSLEIIRVAEKYVVTTARTHTKPTDIVAYNPVLRRRFNPQDIVKLYSKYGSVEWSWVLNTNGQRLLAMYILKFK